MDEAKLAFLKALTDHGQTLQKMAAGGIMQTMNSAPQFQNNAHVGGPTVNAQGSSPQMGGIGGDAGKYTGVGLAFNALNDLTQNHFQASSAPIQQGTNAKQLNNAYDQSQSGIGAQENFLNALQAQNGIQNQSNTYNQMQGVAAGTGPNPAQAMLANATGANVANQAALMAGQRGAGVNPGLVARQAAQQGAAIQQDAAGQGAALQAQQSLNALNSAAGIAQNQVNQQGQATQGYNTAIQNEQNILQGANSAYNNAQVGMQSNINNVNGMISQGNQQAGNALTGGIIKGISGALGGGGGGLFAEGGEVPQANVGQGNYVPTFSAAAPSIGAPGTSADQSGFMGSGGKGGGGGGMDLSAMFSKAAGKAEGGEIENPHGPKSMTARHLNGTAPPQDKPQQQQTQMGPQNQGATLEGLLGLSQGGAAGFMEALQNGGKVPGEPKHPNKNTEKNDVVPALLTPKEIVLPLTVTQSDDPGRAAMEFVNALQKKQKMAQGGCVKMAEGGEATGAPSEEELRSRVQGIGDSIGKAWDTGKEVLFGRGVSAMYDGKPNAEPAPAAADNSLGKAAADPTPSQAPTNVSLGSPQDPARQQMPTAQTDPNFKYDPYQGLNTELAGVAGEAKAAGQVESEKADLFKKHEQDMQAINQQGQQMAAQHQAETQALIDDMKNGHIDPKSYMNHMSSGQKVSTAIGLILGGIGGGIDRSGQNPALEFLNKQIDHDINAQIENRNNKNTIFNAMEKQYGNKKDALNMTHAFYLAKLQNDINTAAAKSGNQLAIARAQQLSGPIQQKLQELHLQTGMRQAAMGGNGGQADPALLVRYLVPPEHQKEVFDSVDKGRNARSLAPKIMAAFDKGSSRNPVTAAQGRREFEGLINTTVTDLTGTARQAEFDSIHNNMSPSGFTALPGENESKRRTILEYLGSKAAASAAKGYGIDLDKFQSTAPLPSSGGFKKRN